MIASGGGRAGAGAATGGGGAGAGASICAGGGCRSDSGIGHMCMVTLQPGSTTASQISGKMISPFGPCKS